MSLDALRAMRRQGSRPGTPVLLVVGACPAWARDLPHVVEVRATDRPALMDLRPLIGLWAAALLLPPADRAQAIAAMDAAREAGADLYGAADAEGAHLFIQDPTPAHESNLRRTWKLYATGKGTL